MKSVRSPLSASPELTDRSPPRCRLPRRSRFIRPADGPRSPSRLSSAVPFSWEQRPGIPKVSITPKSRPTDPLLPLPPPLRFSSSDNFRKKRPDAKPAAAADPFAAALAECAQESRRAATERLWQSSEKTTDRRRKTRPVWSISDRFGIFGLVGSCKSGSCSVADSSVVVSQSSLRTGTGYRLLNRRAA